jgi:hypothetical protein
MDLPGSNHGLIGGVLAQSGQGASEALVWAMVLIVAAIVGGIVILAVRKRMLSAPKDDIGSEGLFDALRRMASAGARSRRARSAARPAATWADGRRAERGLHLTGTARTCARTSSGRNAAGEHVSSAQLREIPRRGRSRSIWIST